MQIDVGMVSAPKLCISPTYLSTRFRVTFWCTSLWKQTVRASVVNLRGAILPVPEAGPY